MTEKPILKTKTPTPPPFAKKLLTWFLRDDLAEEVHGDLEEKFYSMMQNKSLFRAKLSYWYQVFQYMRPFAIRKSKSYHSNHYAMFESYFKIGWRNLSRQKMYSSIKIGGFAAGIAACLLIALFVKTELGYDLHYANGDRIYRIIRTNNWRGETSKGVHFPAPFADALKGDFPELEKVGRYTAVEFFGAGANEFRRAEQIESIHEEGFLFMDQGLLEILELPFVAGSPQHALAEPNTIVITQRKADKYFRGEDPVGKLVILNNDETRQYKVSGVIKDWPVTSHLQCDFLITLSGREFYQGEQNNWRNANYPVYVLLRPGTDVSSLEQKLSLVVNKYFVPGIVKAGSVDNDEMTWTKSMQFKLQPVKEIYLNLDDIGDDLSHGDVRYITLFGAIATFILFIACINFINLSTAKSANRAREVGLRKVVGSLRISLIKQFLTESLLFSLFSFVLGMVIAWLLLPYFSTLVAKSIDFPWKEWWLLPAFTAGTVCIGIVAGLYPAFYLSSFKPALVLKGMVSRGSKSSSLRSALVIFQFTISIVLIVGTLIIQRQMNYVLNKKVGYDKDQVVVLQGAHTLGARITTLKSELLRLPEVKQVTISGYLPVEGTKRNGNGFFKEGGKGVDAPVGGQRWSVDHDYIKTLGLKIIKGRDFSIDIHSDSQAMIINRSMAKALNLEDPVGKKITNGYWTWPVIGVIEDFHFESMKQRIGPLSLMIERSPNSVAVKVNTQDIPGAIRAISKVWKEFSPNQPIRYSFLDESYARMYDDVERMGSIFRNFALLAILVACLGLFALSAFMVEQRNKEISIRLVLGASMNSIFRLLTSNFLKLVCLSLVIAVPLSIYLMQEWLKEFAYKIEITWDVFLLTGFMAVGIALLTISYQSIRAALMKPADCLRSE